MKTGSPFSERKKSSPPWILVGLLVAGVTCAALGWIWICLVIWICAVGVAFWPQNPLPKTKPDSPLWHQTQALLNGRETEIWVTEHEIWLTPKPGFDWMHMTWISARQAQRIRIIGILDISREPEITIRYLDAREEETALQIAKIADKDDFLRAIGLYEPAPQTG